MRIVHILNHTNRSNGHVHAAIDLACAQQQLGHDVGIANGGGDFDALLRANGIWSVAIDHRRRPFTLAKSLVKLTTELRALRPDIVHAHMMTSAVLAWPVCKLLGIPLITTVHNEFEKSAILMGLGARVIAVSNAVGASMVRRGIPASKMRVVLNGTIGSVRFDRNHIEAVRLESPSILFVGGLHPRKGLPDLLEAFRLTHQKYPAARLYIIGAGPLEEHYREIAHSMACASAIVFLGTKRDPYPYMLAADIFVLPSHADPAPLVLSEAREAHCAVIGTDVDGIPQLLEYGSAGIVVPPRNADVLAQTLCRLIDEPGEIGRWRDRSQFQVDNLKIDRVARETMDVYRSALASRTRASAALRHG
jgi:glycosyltransferase involved in cell wall biosynthesis